MLKYFKNIIRKIILFPLHLFNELSILYSRLLSIIDPNGSESYWEELSQSQIDKKINSKLRILNTPQHQSKKFDLRKKINFYTPTKIASYRAKTLLSKEIDTLEWIDEFGSKDSIFFDIGANMGVYSLYYATYHGGKVFAFEPSIRNLDLLIRNINLNKLNELISVVSNPIYNKESMNFFSQKYIKAGEAVSIYGEKKMKNNYKTLSLTLDYLVKKEIILTPNLIKIDVDGNESEVLQGATEIIQSVNCKTILIETRETTSDNVTKILEKFNYNEKTYKQKKDNINNQIWVKSEFK